MVQQKTYQEVAVDVLVKTAQTRIIALLLPHGMLQERPKCVGNLRSRHLPTHFGHSLFCTSHPPNQACDDPKNKHDSWIKPYIFPYSENDKNGKRGDTCGHVDPVFVVVGGYK